MTTLPGSQTQQALTQLLDERYSCRGYLPDLVPPDTLNRLFELAQRTASWCNTQPWQVTVTSGEATSRFAAALSDYTASHPPRSDFEIPAKYAGVYDERRKESGFALYESLGIAREDRAARAEQAGRNFSFFGAPHVAVITTDRDQGVYGAVDCGGYVGTLMLAARSLGLASVAQAAIAMYSDGVREHLGLTEDRMTVCAVSFGYEDPAHLANAFRTTRAPVEVAVDFRTR
ncbi:nitroreductase [Nocardioides sp. 616]|uniref:nitroreductase n=1 Tax=Nocardioides sp. 616 TaxID=2268090 RepID=UPI000CE4AF88|nr:nitroreductase [Nocardioides sp. 616]